MGSSRFFSATLILALAGCNRTEEPVSAPGPEGAAVPSVTSPPPAATTAPTVTTAPADATAQPQAACTAPFGEPQPIASKAAACPRDPTGNLTLPHGVIKFPDAPSAPAVSVELARDDASRERGLMYRTSMAPNAGMLFTWPTEDRRSFWMQNTCIPLDMLFVAKDGTIAGILEQVPTLNQLPRSVPCPAAHVLELNAGWARAHGLAPGMKLVIEG